MLMLAGLALVVGSGGAAAAWLLLKLIALATNLAWYDHASFAPVSIVPAAHGVRTLLVPVAGSMVIGLMARFGSEKIRGHGIPEAIEAILFGQSRLSPKVAVLKPVSAAVSIGSGGPFGAEGPIIMTGGAIGSLLAQCFHLSAAERKTLLVAGAAAGMTAIFGTPVAAMLLAIEVLLFEWKPRSFVPVTVAALAAIAWRPLMIGSGPMFPLVAPMMIDATTLVGAAALGVVVGVLASSLSSALYRIEDGFHRLPVHWMWWPALGALIVGIGGLIDPRVLGAGYDNIQALLDGSMVARAIVLLLVVKAIVWVVALGSGTSGGILAPLLMLGAAVGALAGHWLPGGVGLYAMAGMAAMMSASMRAPLTAAVFAVELTGRLDALPVAAAASVAGYAIAVLVLRRSILTEKIARRGRHLSQEYTVDPLSLVRVGEIMTRDPDTLLATMSVADAAVFFGDAPHRSYPVVDGDGRPVGLVSRADALRWMDSPPDAGAPLGDMISDGSLSTVPPTLPVDRVAELMLAEDIGRVPVVDDGGMLVGLIARRDLLLARTGRHSDERDRMRFTGRKAQ
ncbi:chloride channel protein [Sphingomonas sp. RIT328]|uniref:chloride channel protein n=1 Tax=Sphingomonas sp. RIT328 TaxID=1470591 RepID=UPI0004482EC9|nr:chloride channel protein [Sphingomonas sp. RIT328]EZP54366.1 CBS domain containing protein [Sphingomonas sp. RIT328]